MKRKPKIAVIGAKGFPAWGGAARANEAIFTRLKDRYDVTVYAISSHASETNYNEIKQIIFKAYRNKKVSVFLYYIKSLLHAIFRGRYDLVHVNHRAAGFIIPFLRIKYPVILNVRGMPTQGLDNKWTNNEYRMLLFSTNIGFRFASHIVTVQKGSVSKIESAHKKKVYFIPNGVDNNYASFALENKRNHTYNISFAAARIVYLKGLHLLLDALGKINYGGRVQIIGDINQVEDYKNKLLKAAKTLDCEFAGLIQSKETLFNRIAQSELFVFPSYIEGMSNMLLEVASLKVPIIASDIPPNTEVFSEIEALFFKSGDVNDLQRKISWALNNQAQMTEKAELAYRKVITHHNWDDIALKYAAIYDKIIDK